MDAMAGPLTAERTQWIEILVRVAEPVMASCAANRLKSSMPVESAIGHQASRRTVTHLEAIGRTLAGIAPWLGVAGVTDAEETVRARFAALARQMLANAVDRAAEDYIDFTADRQNLVDAAFLALGLSRARGELWETLNPAVRTGIIAALQSTALFSDD
jgi:hypothetical protein